MGLGSGTPKKAGPHDEIDPNGLSISASTTKYYPGNPNSLPNSPGEATNNERPLQIDSSTSIVFVDSRMQMFVRSPDGRVISLSVCPDETLYDVKKKIMEKHNLVCDGVRMDDNCRTLADYNIKHQSTLDLEEKMQIYVKETVHGLTCTVNVDRSDTIDSIKSKIEATDGFPKSQQCLIFADQQLEDTRTLADYNICKDSTLLLVLYPCPEGRMQIFVKTLGGRTLTLMVDSSDTINSIRLKIYERDGTRTTHQRLIFAGYSLDGNRTLASYKIPREATIHLVHRLCGS